MEVRFYIPFFLLMLLVQNVFAEATADSNVLTYEEYISNVLTHHPMAKSANLEIEKGVAELLIAKGAFDPTLNVNWDEKHFKDDLYYRQYDANLRFNTPVGVSVVTGYENSEGINVNPENKTDKFGLWNIGIELDVLQGLIINERRATLQQAKLFQNMSQNERDLALNELIYEATSAYLYWQYNFYYQAILQENIAISERYFENTKQTFLGGEKTAMDTLEAYIQYQSALANLSQNEVLFIKAQLALENYLWFEQTPIALRPSTQPEKSNQLLFTSLDLFETENIDNHPMIVAKLNKLSSLEIKQRLNREKLKPKLKLKYNPLLATSDNSLQPNFSASNFKWGFNFSFPLMLRSGRGNVRKTAIAMEQQQLDLDFKRTELKNKIESSWLQRSPLAYQIDILTANIANYNRLLEGENIKFSAGESSVFLLNKRQEKYIDSQLKLIATYYKLHLENLNFLYYSNQLIN